MSDEADLISDPFVEDQQVKTLLRLLYAVFMVFALGHSISAQSKSRLPAGLNQNSSLSEIIAWLDQTSFSKARISLEDTWDVGTYQPPWLDELSSEASFYFSEGFRVSAIEGCKFVLKNDDARMFPDSLKKTKDSDQRYVAEVILLLNKMSRTKGRRTYRYTNDPEKARVLGPWRTEFKHQGWFGRPIVGLHLNSAGWKEKQAWEGRNLAFTFDNKETSEQFDAAFRQAIRVCRSK